MPNISSMQNSALFFLFNITKKVKISMLEINLLFISAPTVTSCQHSESSNRRDHDFPLPWNIWACCRNGQVYIMIYFNYRQFNVYTTLDIFNMLNITFKWWSSRIVRSISYNTMISSQCFWEPENYFSTFHVRFDVLHMIFLKAFLKSLLKMV